MFKNKNNYLYLQEFLGGGEKRSNRVESNIPMSAAACNSLKETKLCNGHPMDCIGDTCKYHVEPVEAYTWLESVESSETKCEFSYRRIIAEHEDSIIATTKVGPCRPSDLSCVLPNGIMIWDKTILHSCPYGYVQTGNFTASGSVIYSTPGSKLSVNNTAVHALFQLLEPVEACGVLFYGTSEDLYVTQQEVRHLTKDALAPDLQVMQHLTLADEDFTAFILNEAIIKLHILTNTLNCLSFKMLLESLRKINQNQFIKINDPQGNNLIIYVEHGNLYIPQCQPINTIYLINETSYCYQDFPIKLLIGDNFQSAFLTSAGVITSTSTKVNCSQPQESLILNKLWLARYQQTYIVHRINESSLYNIRTRSIQMANLDFNHNVQFNLDIDVMDQLDHSTSILDSGHKFNILRDEALEPKPSFITRLGLTFPNMHDFYIKLILLIVLLIVFIILILIIVCVTLQCCDRRKTSTAIERYFTTNTCDITTPAETQPRTPLLQPPRDRTPVRTIRYVTPPPQVNEMEEAIELQYLPSSSHLTRDENRASKLLERHKRYTREIVRLSHSSPSRQSTQTQSSQPDRRDDDSFDGGMLQQNMTR